MAYKLAIHSVKGGVFKTSTSVSLSANLAKKGYKVLIIDCDVQNNVILNFDVNKNQDDKLDLFNMIVSNDYADVLKYCFPVSSNIDVIVNSFEGLNFDYNVYTNQSKYPQPLRIFDNFINILESQYDFILFDLSPAYTLYNLNALLCSDSVLILTELEVFALKGLITNIKTLHDMDVPILGVLETKVVPNTKLYKQLHSDLKYNMKNLGIHLFKNSIPRLAEQPKALYEQSKNISLISDTKRTSYTYKNLTNEILQLINYN